MRGAPGRLAVQVPWPWGAAPLLALLLATGACAPAPPAPAPAAEPPGPAIVATELEVEERLPPGLAGQIVFASDREGRPKLYTIDLASTAITRLTEGRDHRDEDPVWSPDGTMIAFATTRFGATYDIAISDASGGRVRQLTAHPAFERHPMWTADGRRVLFSSEQDGTQAVFELTIETGTIARVSPGPDRALLPAPGPGPNEATYTQGTAEGLQLIVRDVAAGSERQLTHGATGAARARWSPDRTRLAYTRLNPVAPLLEVLEARTGRTQAFRLAGVRALDDVAWSPDGRFLVAAGARGTGDSEDWDLVLLPANATGPAHRVTAGRGNDRSPSWSPR